jgi:hypothetical protein
MRNVMAATVIGGCLAYLLITACGSWGKSPTAPHTPSPPSGPTVTIDSAGLTPRAIEVPVGGRLTIVNHDSVAHDMGSDPHPGREDCPALNQIGRLEAGQARSSGPLVAAGTCGMHDHLRPLVAAFHLRITVR